ncbi:ROK family transcriptional regulator [Leifsonia aquatica]|uniref:ROK family transcriptional regulator n=1 Tax=Leifsonia aquatica TaxID=144185 RepID=UPI0028B2542C|nr:ROK family transcriptional regulator [Leifsonia aquatica]
MGGYNEAVLLDVVRRSADGISQVQLTRETGLSPQTVSNIVRRLLDQGILKVVGMRGEGRGKPQTLLKLNAGSRYAVGLHLDPSIVTYVICDMEGRIVSERSDTEAITNDAVSTVRNLADGVSHLLYEAPIDRALVPGVGIAAPGPVDLESGSIYAPRWLKSLERLDLAEALSRALGLPVLLDKDTVAAATGENWVAARDDLSALFIYVGTGIGSSLSVSGEVSRGYTNNAGEIGHLTVDPGGELCECGRRGCLGRASDPAWLVADAIRDGVLPDTGESSPHAVDVQVTSLCAMAESAQSPARALLEHSAMAVAEAVRMLVAIHDPEKVIVGGPFWSRFEPYYLPAMERALKDNPEKRLRTPSLHSSNVRQHVEAVGAASLVLDAAYSPRPDTFLWDPKTPLAKL